MTSLDDLRLTAFFLADHAEAVNGKLYVTGGCWNTLSVGQIPTTYHHLSVCVAVDVPWELTNHRHEFEVRLVDADGRDVLPQAFAGEFEAGRPPGMRPGDVVALVMVLNLNNMAVSQSGTHEFVLSVDDRPLGRARFTVQLVEQPAQ